MADKTSKPEDEALTTDSDETECFVIMPISDHPDYPSGHFHSVYRDIIVPGCKKAGLVPKRADEVNATNLIHLDILKRLINAPIAVCDLSSRNPNVMFELGIRQAFDRPVVLLKDEETPRIFDIDPIRHLTYSRELKYHAVMQSQSDLAQALSETIEQDGVEGAVNSIVKLLALAKATVPDITSDKKDFALQVLLAEVKQLNRRFDRLEKDALSGQGSIRRGEYDPLTSIIFRAEDIYEDEKIEPQFKFDQLNKIEREVSSMIEMGPPAIANVGRMILKRINALQNQLLAENKNIIPF